jgi:hypothetical protein
MKRILTGASLILALFLNACNLPAVQDPAAIVPMETSVALTVEAQLGSSAGEESAPEIVQPTEPATLEAEFTTVTLDGGTGYIFATGATSTDDRDVWWNAAELVPNTRMLSLGVVSSLSEVDAVALSMMAFDSFEPQLGEAFAIEIDRERDDAVEAYALIRVLAIIDRVITFEYIYPYKGATLP